MSILLELSKYALHTRYKTDTKGSISIMMVDLSSLLSYLDKCYTLIPKDTIQVWSIELFIEDKWITTIRTYYCKKTIDDFDLCSIPNKRRNSRLIEIK